MRFSALTNQRASSKYNSKNLGIFIIIKSGCNRRDWFKPVFVNSYPFICKLVTLLLLRIGRLVPHCNHQGGPTLGNHPELETKQQVTSQYDPNRPVLAGPSPNRLVDQNSKTSQTSCICLPKQNDISFVISG